MDLPLVFHQNPFGTECLLAFVTDKRFALCQVCPLVFQKGPWQPEGFFTGGARKSLARLLLPMDIADVTDQIMTLLEALSTHLTQVLVVHFLMHVVDVHLQITLPVC